MNLEDFTSKMDWSFRKQAEYWVQCLVLLTLLMIYVRGWVFRT